MRVIGLFFLALVTGELFASCGGYTSSVTELTICDFGAPCKVFPYSELQGNSTKRQEQELETLLQEYYDQRVLLSILPPSDPVKMANPNCAGLFWGDASGNPVDGLYATHLITRACVVIDVFYDVGLFIPLVGAPSPCP